MSDEVMADLRAALVDRYVIERELGRGGMATVYLATDLKLERQVAVKVLAPELGDALSRERFLREIAVAARLQHPNLVPLYDSGSAAELLYYVMPAIEGETLRDRLRREAHLPVEDAFRVARDVAEALAHVHAHGLVHRDVKPENIFLVGGHALLADFGIAQVVVAAGGERLTARGLAIGTPAYMSPEQAGAEDIVDGRSDVYALGCVVYEMLAGDPPFTGRTPHAILARQLGERPPSLRVVRPTVGLRVQRTIEKALAKVPADRFSTATAFAEALTAPSRRPLVMVVLGVAAALAIVFGLRSLVAPRDPISPSGREYEPNQVAVLYFEDRSADGSLRHVANGLTEGLIDALSSVDAIQVVPPSGVEPFRGEAVTLDSLARVLRVGSLVEGTVTRSGSRYTATVRLVDVAARRQIGSATVEGPSGDLFVIQRQMAEDVARFLRGRLGRAVALRESRQATQSVRAWELTHQAETWADDARALSRVGRWAEADQMLASADSLLASAEELDRAWSEPVIQRGWIARTRADAAADGTEWTLLHAGLSHADRVLARSPDDAAALELRGYLLFRLSRTDHERSRAVRLLTDADRALRQAVVRDPTRARAWNALGLLHYMGGRFSEAQLALERGLAADAYLSETATNLQLLFFTALEAGEPDSAVTWCALGRARFPKDLGFVQCDLIALGWTGRTAAQLREMWQVLSAIERDDASGELVGTWGFRRMMVAAVAARAGLAESARNIVRATLSNAPSAEAIRNLELYEACVYATLGDATRAVDRLRVYLSRMPHDAGWVSQTRWFASLRADAGFQSLVRRPAPAPVQRGPDLNLN